MQPHQEHSLIMSYWSWMLAHIADALPPMLHLPVSPDDTLHFYRYLRTNILMENTVSSTD